MIIGDGGMLTRIWVANGGEVTGVWALSVAVTVNGKGPATEGVPDTDPLAANVKPGGNVPVAFHVYGAEPPLALNPKPGYT